MNSIKSITTCALVFGLVAMNGCGDSEDTEPNGNEGDGSVTEDSGGEGQKDGDVQGSPDAGGQNGEDASGGGSNDAGGGGGSDATVTGTPTGEWENVTGSLAGLASTCGNTSPIFASPNENRLLVNIAAQGLYASTDGASTWVLQGKGTGSDPLDVRMSHIVFDPSDPDVYYVSGIYTDYGVYKTEDDGETFKRLGTVHHNDSVAVDFGDPDRKTLLAGGHEQGQTVWRSTDSGDTWSNIGTTLPNGTGASSYVYIVDAQTYMVGVDQGGIYRTTNGGGSWTKVSDHGGGAAPLLTSEGTLLWASSKASGLARSYDDGATWEAVIQQGGVVYNIPPLELPDGRIATRGDKGVIVSSDEGETWVAVAPPQPFGDLFTNFALAYSTEEKAFFVNNWDCNDVVPAEAVVRFDWDYTKN